MSRGQILLAIDPGPEQSAYVRFCVDTMQPADGAILQNAILLLRLSMMEANRLVIEQVQSYGMPVGAEVFETVFWSGRFAQEWHREFDRLGRIAVKKSLCHRTAGVNDAVIRQRLIDLYGGRDKAIGTKKTPGPLHWVKKDLWAALALAYVAASQPIEAGAVG